MCFIIKFATAGNRVPNNVQSVRISSYAFYNLQFSPLKNNEDGSLIFPDVTHCMVVLDANFSSSNLWSTAQFVLARVAMLKRFSFLFCFHVKWEIRTGLFNQGKHTQGISSLG